jgi:hypothetical protein
MRIVHANGAYREMGAPWQDQAPPSDHDDRGSNVLFPADRIAAEGNEPRPGSSIPRAFFRLPFQLPVLARIGGTVFRCKSVDISARGLSILAQRDFPQMRDPFNLICLDPDGAEIRLRVRETNRRVTGQGGAFVRVGLMAVGGSRAFFHFLEKHKLLRPPDIEKAR